MNKRWVAQSVAWPLIIILLNSLIMDKYQLVQSMMDIYQLVQSELDVLEADDDLCIVLFAVF